MSLSPLAPEGSSGEGLTGTSKTSRSKEVARRAASRGGGVGLVCGLTATENVFGKRTCTTPLKMMTKENSDEKSTDAAIAVGEKEATAAEDRSVVSFSPLG